MTPRTQLTFSPTQLHRAIVSPMNPEARLTILFDCCHSGSACELPFVFRPDQEGNINLMDQLKKGIGLVRAAEQLVQGGWSRDKVSDAKMLLGGATDFFNSLHHMRDNETDPEGLAAENFREHWETEGKDVWMFSGCRDDQTSADATISGTATGAMSWAFIGTMKENPGLSYVQVRPGRRMGEHRALTVEQVLQSTRERLLDQYQQIPQLSCGGHYDLDQPLRVSTYLPTLTGPCLFSEVLTLDSCDLAQIFPDEIVDSHVAYDKVDQFRALCKQPWKTDNGSKDLPRGLRVMTKPARLRAKHCTGTLAEVFQTPIAATAPFLSFATTGTLHSHHIHARDALSELSIAHVQWKSF